MSTTTTKITKPKKFTSCLFKESLLTAVSEDQACECSVVRDDCRRGVSLVSVMMSAETFTPRDIDGKQMARLVKWEGSLWNKTKFLFSSFKV